MSPSAVAPMMVNIEICSWLRAALNSVRLRALPMSHHCLIGSGRSRPARRTDMAMPPARLFTGPCTDCSVTTSSSMKLPSSCRMRIVTRFSSNVSSSPSK